MRCPSDWGVTMIILAIAVDKIFRSNRNDKAIVPNYNMTEYTHTQIKSDLVVS